MADLAQILKRLKPVKRGDDVRRVLTADFINAIIEGLAALARGDNFFTGANLSKKIGPAFLLVSGAPGGGAAQTPATPAAPGFFQLVIASTTVEGVTTLKVKVTASDINGTEIDEQIFTVTETGKVWARVTSNSDYVETDWAIENGAAVPDSDELNGYVPIGNYAVDGETLTVFPNLRFGPVGYLNATDNDHLWW